MEHGIVSMEGHDGSTFWLEEVKYVQGLNQNLLSVASEIAQNLVKGATQNGEHVSIKVLKWKDQESESHSQRKGAVLDAGQPYCR
jgi:hypothetical protein